MQNWVFLVHWAPTISEQSVEASNLILVIRVVMVRHFI